MATKTQPKGPNAEITRRAFPPVSLPVLQSTSLPSCVLGAATIIYGGFDFLRRVLNTVNDEDPNLGFWPQGGNCKTGHAFIGTGNQQIKISDVRGGHSTGIVLLWCDVDHKWLIGVVCHSHWEIYFRFAGLNYAKRPWLSPKRAGASEQFNKFIASRRNWKFRTHILPSHPPTLRWPWQHQQEPRILIDVRQDNVVHGYKEALLWNFPPDEPSFPRLFTYVRFSDPAALLFAFGSRHLKIKQKKRREEKKTVFIS